MERRNLLEAVIFDVWGTMLYPRVGLKEYYMARAAAIADALKKLGLNVSVDDVLRAFWEARKTANAMRKHTLCEVPLKAEVVLLLKELGLDYSDEEIVDSVAAVYMRPYIELLQAAPHLTELLSFLLRAGVKLGVVSNSLDHSSLSTVLRKHGLSGFFDVVIASDRMCMIKPRWELFILASSALCSIPANTVFVGDEEADIRGAKLVGMWTVAYEGFHPYTGVAPHFKVKDFLELREIIETMFRPTERSPGKRL